MKTFPQSAFRPVLVSLASGLGVWLYVLAFMKLNAPAGPASTPDEIVLTPFEVSKPALGEVAPNFTLCGTDGQPFRLSREVGRLPVVIEFGSW